MKNMTDLDTLSKCIHSKLGILTTPEPDDQFHRYPAPGKESINKACWLKVSEDGRIAHFGNFTTGESYTWHSNTTVDDIDQSLPDFEDEKRRYLAERRLAWQEQAALKANQLLSMATPTKNHPYTSSKQISSTGLYQNGQELLIPLQDINGKILNLQRIYPDGRKYFMKGGQVNGLFALCGKLYGTAQLYVCEGYATTSTIHELTGQTTVAAMNAGNLMAVCQLLDRHKPSHIQIIVAADNDHTTEGNPGKTKGLEAAQAITADFLYPPLPCYQEDCSCSDFNDLEHCLRRTEGSSND